MSEYKANKSIVALCSSACITAGMKTTVRSTASKSAPMRHIRLWSSAQTASLSALKAPAASGLQAKKPSKWMAFSYWQISMMACAKIFALKIN